MHSEVQIIRMIAKQAYENTSQHTRILITSDMTPSMRKHNSTITIDTFF